MSRGKAAEQRARAIARAEARAGVLDRAREDPRFRFLLDDPVAVEQWVDGIMALLESTESAFDARASRRWVR